jgi:hypothetical protein
VVESLYGDRWMKSIVVEFDSGAVWAPKAAEVVAVVRRAA